MASGWDGKQMGGGKGWREAGKDSVLGPFISQSGRGRGRSGHPGSGGPAFKKPRVPEAASWNVLSTQDRPGPVQGFHCTYLERLPALAARWGTGRWGVTRGAWWPNQDREGRSPAACSLRPGVLGVSRLLPLTKGPDLQRPRRSGVQGPSSPGTQKYGLPEDSDRGSGRPRPHCGHPAAPLGHLPPASVSSAKPRPRQPRPRPSLPGGRATRTPAPRGRRRCASYLGRPPRLPGLPLARRRLLLLLAGCSDAR